MIPKIFHRVWLGGKPMPFHFARWGESWMKKHPSWTMKLWTEAEVKYFTNVDLLPKCSSLAMRSDIIRYAVLYKHGGVYLDTDMECVKNIDMLAEGIDFFACWQRPQILSNAIFGTAAKSKIMQSLVWCSRSEFKPEPWNAMGPEFFTKKVVGQPGVRIYDRKVFIPYTRDEYKAFPKKPMAITNPPPESYAINHRASIWYEDSTAKILPPKVEPVKIPSEMQFAARVKPTTI